MKYHQTIAALGCALLAINIAHSAILTVDNKVGSVAMYNSVQSACNAAAPGDTILIAGSPTGYGGLTITKRLNLVGPRLPPKRERHSWNHEKFSNTRYNKF